MASKVSNTVPLWHHSGKTPRPARACLWHVPSRPLFLELPCQHQKHRPHKMGTGVPFPEVGAQKEETGRSQGTRPSPCPASGTRRVQTRVRPAEGGDRADVLRVTLGASCAFFPPKVCDRAGWGHCGEQGQRLPVCPQPAKVSEQDRPRKHHFPSPNVRADTSEALGPWERSPRRLTRSPKIYICSEPPDGTFLKNRVITGHHRCYRLRASR